MARILVLESEAFFSSALANILNAEGHSFVLVRDGRLARETLEREDFDCMISDAKVSGFSGVEVARWIEQRKPTPLILMAGFAEQADACKPYGLLNVTLLVKPFNVSQVREALAKALPGGVPTGTQAVEALVPVPRIGIRAAGIAEVNLFHYVAGRPKLVAMRGDGYILDQLGIEATTCLYTDRRSLDHLLSTSLMQAHVSAERRIDPAKKAARIQDALQLIGEQMAAVGVSAKLTEAALEVVAAYMKSLEDGGVWELFSSLDTYARPIYAQTLAVTMIAMLIAQEQKFSTQDCFKLTTAALFHDVGFTALEQVLVKTPRVMLSMKDRAAIEKHVDIGVAMLQRSGWISHEVCAIVWQHHESALGNGYPRGLRLPQIHHMARILRVADEFCSLTLKSAGQVAMPPMRAIDQLKERRELDPKYVIALHRVLLQKEPVKA